MYIMAALQSAINLHAPERKTQGAIILIEAGGET